MIDGEEYNITSHHWNERKIRSGGDEGVCYSKIDTLDIMQPGQGNLFILGDSFMQLYYSVFDRDTDKVGLASAHHE